MQLSKRSIVPKTYYATLRHNDLPRSRRQLLPGPLYDSSSRSEGFTTPEKRVGRWVCGRAWRADASCTAPGDNETILLKKIQTFLWLRVLNILYHQLYHSFTRKSHAHLGQRYLQSNHSRCLHDHCHLLLHPSLLTLFGPSSFVVLHHPSVTVLCPYPQTASYQKLDWTLLFACPLRMSSLGCHHHPVRRLLLSSHPSPKGR